MRAHLVNLVVKHRKWIKMISADILNMKKWELSDYLNDLVMPNFKLDKIALMIYARMYHIDLGVVLHKTYWCAAKHDNIFKAKVVFVFEGNWYFWTRRPIQGVLQVSEDQPTNKEASPPRVHSTKNSQQAGRFTNQKWHDLFDPHKAPPPSMPPPLPPIHTPTPDPVPPSKPIKDKWKKRKK